MAMETLDASLIGEDADAEPPSCVDIIIDDARWDAVGGLAPLLHAVSRHALIECGLNPDAHTFALALTGDDIVRTLNRDFAGKVQPTNVLSFPALLTGQRTVGEQSAFLGDIAIAYETVVEEAACEHKSVAHHTAHLTVHGIFHLCGYDHDTDETATIMEQKERSVLARVFIPDPYDEYPLSSQPITAF